MINVKVKLMVFGVSKSNHFCPAIVKCCFYIFASFSNSFFNRRDNYQIFLNKSRTFMRA